MSLQDIQTTLEGLAKQNQLTFGKIVGQVSSFFLIDETVPLSAGIALPQPSFKLDTNKLVITDTVKWVELESVDVVITITPDKNSKYISQLTMTLPKTKALAIPSVTWFRLDSLSIGLLTSPYNFYVNAITFPVTTTLGATLHVTTQSKDVPIPITIALNPDGTLLLNGNFSSIEFPSVKEILAALGDSSGVNVPDSINNLTRLALYDVSLGFDPTVPSVSLVGVEIGNAEGVVLEIIPGVLKLSKYRLGLTVANPLGPSRAVGGLISGQLVLGTGPNAVTIDVYALHPPSGGWDFKGSVGPVNIGALVDGLMSDFGVTIPNSLKSLKLKSFTIAFNTATGAASGSFTLDFTVGDTPVEISATLKLTKKNGKYQPDLEGKLTIGSSNFKITFTDSTFTAQLDAGEKPVTFHDLAKIFGFKDVPEIPPSLELNLTEASFTYDTAKKELFLTAISTYGKAVFITQTKDATTLYAFGFNIHLGITLADIPLVGDKLPDAENLGIPDAGIWVLSKPVLKAQAEQLNQTITKLSAKLPTLPDADSTGRVLLSADLQLGPSNKTPLQLSLAGDQTPKPPPQLTTGTPTQGGSTTLPQTTPTTTPPATSDNTKWFNVEKQFGVFQFKRVGVKYEANTLMFAMDAAVTLGPLTFSMDGLSVGSPLTEFKPKFDLSGLGLAYVKPPLEIMGALLKVPGSELAPGVKFQFDGLLVMKSMSYSLSAIGSYAQLKSEPSLFVFAQLEAALGGPPFFFITGLMAGFGFNRLLTIPGQDEVSNFPLLALAQPPAPGAQAQKQDPMAVLDILEGRKPITPGGQQKKWIVPSTGNYWLAVGIQFTSFELVTSKALLIVEFGDEFQVVLLGLSTMRLPKSGDAVYAYVELQLKAVFKPQEGFFGLTAILSNNSFVIDPACHLTGGFAFYLWFGSNPHAGQFVITIGGYHPAFKPPDFFPTVPRLGFNWAVSDTISIKGNAYFALTTSCIMAGGGLEVLFQSGDLRAWFTAQADLLISWHPFFFRASISVDIGVSYRLNLLFCTKTISISIGASVDLWGPPTGGVVHVHLWVISFSVRFGSDLAGQQNEALKWDGFKSLLPAKNDAVKVTVSDGLYKSEDSTKSTSGKSWVVRATNFRFFTQSAVPASHLTYGSGSKPKVMLEANEPTINVKPMNLKGVTSTHAVTIHKDTLNSPPIDVSKWDLKPRSQNVPDSLWGAPPAKFSQIPDKPAADVVPNQPVGYNIQAPPPTIGTSQGLIPLSALAEEFVLQSSTPISPTVKPVPDFVPKFSQTSVAEIQKIMSDGATKGRLGLFNAMQGTGVYTGPNGTLNNMASQANHIFSDAPMVQS